MTRPTARVLALLEILQSGGTRTVGELATRLGVDERTVRRYAVHLTDLDIPVRSVRGRYGGYRLAPGYRLPPLMFTDEEALAVLLGLTTGRAVEVGGSDAAVESAAAKMRRVLPAVLARRLAAVLETTEFTSGAHQVAAPIAPPAGPLLVLAEAVRERRAVAIRYTAADGQQTVRTVHPFGIVAHSGRWYLTGEDPAIGEVRTFRLDRIATVEIRPGSFIAPADFDPTERVLTGLARAPRRHDVSLRVQGSRDQVLARIPAGLAVIDEIPGSAGLLRVQLRTERLDWVPALLAQLGLPFVLEQPDELRELLRTLARQLDTAAAVTGR